MMLSSVSEVGIASLTAPVDRGGKNDFSGEEVSDASNWRRFLEGPGLRYLTAWLQVLLLEMSQIEQLPG